MANHEIEMVISLSKIKILDPLTSIMCPTFGLLGSDHPRLTLLVRKVTMTPFEGSMNQLMLAALLTELKAVS